MAVSTTDREQNDARAAGVWAIVVAAGEGHRFGGAKQFRPLGDRCVIDWAVQGIARWCEGLVVVLPEARAVGEDAWSPPPVSPGRCSGGVVVAAGGVLRSDSVRCGLSLVPGDAEIVLVHDGARPLAGDAAVRAGDSGRARRRRRSRPRDRIDRHDPAPRRRNRRPPRAGGRADAAGFRAAALRAAHVSGADATDDATLVEAAGGTVTMVAGDSRNLKITEPHDLALAEVLLRAGEELDTPGGDRG